MLQKVLLPAVNFAHPGKYFATGIIYTLLGALLGMLFFPGYQSMAMLFIIVIGCLPMMYVLAFEEEKYAEGTHFFSQYADLLRAMIYLFGGMGVAFLALVLVLPQHMLLDLFAIQAPFLEIYHASSFWEIFSIQLRLLFICFALSLLFGSGAILFMAISASVLALFAAGMLPNIVPMSIVIFFQVAGFVCAGFAAAILSVALAKNHFATKRMRNAFTDIGVLLAVSVLLLVIATLLKMLLL